MGDESAGNGTAGAQVSAAARRALTALLRMDADRAAEVRARTPSRRRPTRQYGPRLDLGDPGD